MIESMLITKVHNTFFFVLFANQPALRPYHMCSLVAQSSLFV